MHRHRKIRESAPIGCSGGVAFIVTCACGAKKKTCSCYQCKQQGTSLTGWYMPYCSACGRNHAEDKACAS